MGLSVVAQMKTDGFGKAKCTVPYIFAYQGGDDTVWIRITKEHLGACGHFLKLAFNKHLGLIKTEDI